MAAVMPGGTDVSLLGDIGSALKGGIKGFATGGIAGAGIGALKGLAKGTTRAPPQSALNNGLIPLPTANTMSASSILRAGAKTGLNIATRAGGALVRNAGSVAGAVATGVVLYDAFGNIVGTRRRRRRMNPMNARAARRAIRRIKGARKMLQQIERQLPKQRVHSRSGGSRRPVQEFIRQG